MRRNKRMEVSEMGKYEKKQESERRGRNLVREQKREEGQVEMEKEGKEQKGSMRRGNREQKDVDDNKEEIRKARKRKMRRKG
ncbi:hypothetical protein PoB_004743100 [Plakobranchus ocellatus]|uniref:Uncharacterized protein n=1 Tax=Plakobranchus ocellatus TaxID=259542 RepID=A0AAV4BPJ2_9GAST|nr:hypothetical protein PoB_004743100 [Plakobranchus ocellatus]